MARLPRLVLPGIPHHVTQRGNGRQQTFFCDDDYAAYRDLLTTHCAAHGVAVWSWVLMPNHVHLILVPEQVDGLRAALAKVHRAYAALRKAESVGRPVGSPEWLEEMELRTGRVLRPGKRGPTPRGVAA